MSRSAFSPSYDALLRTLKEARRAAGLRQADLAKRLGKPQAFVSKVERGERRIDVIEFIVIARAIGIDEIAVIVNIAGTLPPDARI